MLIFKKGLEYLNKIVEKLTPIEDRPPLTVRIDKEGNVVDVIDTTLPPDMDVTLYKNLREGKIGGLKGPVPHEAIMQTFQYKTPQEITADYAAAIGKGISGYITKKEEERQKKIAKNFQEVKEGKKTVADIGREEIKRTQEIGKKIGKGVGEFTLDIPKYVVRGLTSAFLSTASPQKPEVELKPKELGLPTIIYGEDPIKSVALIYDEQKKKLVDSGFNPKSKLTNTLAGLSAAALVLIETDLGAGGKAKNKLAKEIIDKIEGEMGRTLKKEEVKQIVKDVAKLGELKTKPEKEVALNAIVEHYLNKAVRETKDDEFKWFKEAMEIQHYEDKYGDPVVYLPDKNIYANLKELTPEQRIKFIEKANEIPFSVEGKKAKPTEGLPGALLKQRNIVEGSGAKQTTLKDIIKQHPELEKVYNEIAKPTDERAFNIKLEKLGLEETEMRQYENRVKQLKPYLEKQRGKPITHKELKREAEKAKILDEITYKDRQAHLDLMASIAATERRTAEIEKLLKETKDPKLRQALQEEQARLIRDVVAPARTLWGRVGHVYQITHKPKTMKEKVIADLSKTVDDLEALSKEVLKTDFSNPQSVDALYRKFSKPSFWDKLEELRYNSMLSSPRTQFKNAAYNVLVTLGVRPTTQFIENGLDLLEVGVKGKLTAEEIKKIKEPFLYWVHALGGMSQGWRDLWAIMKENKFIEKPDLAENLRRKGFKHKTMRFWTNLTEGIDVFFSDMIKAGEQARLLARGESAEKAALKAQRIADDYLLRMKLDTRSATKYAELQKELRKLNKNLKKATTKKEINRLHNKISKVRGEMEEIYSQGHLLQFMDKMAAAVDQLRKADIKALKPIGWMIPFLRTITQFGKKWIEYGPWGVATLWGHSHKKEQLAKAILGSIATLIGIEFAMNDKTTWMPPKDKTERNLFYAAQRKPISININGYDIPMIYFGPLALALAMPAAFKYYHKDSPKAFTDDELTKIVKTIMSGMELMSEQTYIENVGKFIDILTNKQDANLQNALVFSSTQFFPMAGLIRWISTLVDDTYRKADTWTEHYERMIPFLSKELLPHTLPTGEPSKRNIFSWIAPYDIGKVKEEYDRMINDRQKELQTNAILGQIDKETQKEAEKIIQQMRNVKTPKEAEKIINQLSENKLLKAAVKAMMEKQARYMAELVKPYKGMSPDALAKVIINRMLETKTKEDFEETQEFLSALQEQGIFDERVKKRLKTMLLKIELGEKIKQKR